MLLMADLDEDESASLITISFLSDHERKESVVLVRQRNASSSRPRWTQGGGHQQHKQKLCEQPSSWANLKKLTKQFSTESATEQEKPKQQQQQNPTQPLPQLNRDFFSSLFDKLSGSLSAVSETAPAETSEHQHQPKNQHQPQHQPQQQPQHQLQHQHLSPQQPLTYRLYNQTRTRRFKDSPPPQPGEAEAGGGACVGYNCDELGAGGCEGRGRGVSSGRRRPSAEKAAEEATPDIVRFLLEHQAKCWPGPVSNGSVANFGHPIFEQPPIAAPTESSSPAAAPVLSAALESPAMPDAETPEADAETPKADTETPEADAETPQLPPQLQHPPPTPPPTHLNPHRSSTIPRLTSPTLHHPSPTPRESPVPSDSGSCGLGLVKLALDFNFKSSAFAIHVIECHGLPLGDSRRMRTDCYVKTYLLPDQTRGARRKTRVRKNSQCPIFDEKLKYQISLSDLETRKLHVSAWHSADLLKPDRLLGELEISMNSATLECRDARWYSLTLLTPGAELQLAHSRYIGEVTLSLKYVTPDSINITNINQVASKGELRIWIKEARNLASNRIGAQVADPYVKLCLLPNRAPRHKRKTPPVHKSCSPVWNLVLKYENVSVSELRSRSLELTIWDRCRLMPGRKLCLGCVLLQTSSDAATADTNSSGAGAACGRSPQRQSDESRMWRTVLQRHNVWVDGNFLLREPPPPAAC